MLPLAYDSASVTHAAAAGELLAFGISSDNLKNYVFVDYFSQGVLDWISAGKITLAPHLFNENIIENNLANADDNEDDVTDLQCPITHFLLPMWEHFAPETADYMIFQL
jgi:hypothetical protein